MLIKWVYPGKPKALCPLEYRWYSSLMELRISPIFADPGDTGDLQLPDEPNREIRAEGQLLWKVSVPEEEMWSVLHIAYFSLDLYRLGGM